MTTAEGFAPAKINLTLHITGQRADGYHLLDSLVVFADVGDRLSFAPHKALALSVTGPFAEGVPADARNLVWQAADAAGVSAHITLEKNLPHGGGIGGGSSDAAAVLRAFDAPEAALSLGADVPVCLAATAQRMRGVGEVLEPVAGLPALWAVLINPGLHVGTPEVFRALGQKDNAPMPEALPEFASAAEMIAWLGTQRNDLEGPARAVAPGIGEVLSVLRDQPGVGLARMSGSGSTCFGLFEDQAAAEQAAARVTQAHPEWWVVPTRLS